MSDNKENPANPETDPLAAAGLEPADDGSGPSDPSTGHAVGTAVGAPSGPSNPGTGTKTPAEPFSGPSDPSTGH